MADDRPMVPATRVTGTNPPRKALPRANYRVTKDPVVRAELVTMLAMGEHNVAQISQHFGIDRGAVYRFRGTWAKQIAAERVRLQLSIVEDEKLWIADKQRRLEALQDVAERLLVEMDEGDPDRLAEYARTLTGVFREAADELGQIPNRAQVETKVKVSYEILGADGRPMALGDLT